MNREPLFDCDGGCECGHYEEDLRVFEGKVLCEYCWEDRVWPEAPSFEQAFSDLPPFKSQHLAKNHPGDPWQPIETAPKDGSKILLYGRCGALDGYYDYDPTVELGKFWDGSIEGFEDGLWAPISSCPHDLVIDATHWMPLPKPPKEGSEE